MYLMPPSYVDVCGKLDTVTVTCFLHTDDFQLGKHNEKEITNIISERVNYIEKISKVRIKRKIIFNK